MTGEEKKKRVSGGDIRVQEEPLSYMIGQLSILGNALAAYNLAYDCFINAKALTFECVFQC